MTKFLHNENEYDSKSKVIIVGNSPTVLNYENGKWIDGFDVVIRVNRCATEGFEKNIGSKTDIWATVKAYGLQPQNPGYEPFVPSNFSQIKEVWHRTPLSRQKLVLPKKNKVLHRVMWKNQSFKKNFSEYTDKQTRLNMKSGQVFDNGLLTIMNATLLFSDITIYGFSFYTESEGFITSYYRDSELDSKGKHHEDEAWARQKDNGFITDEATYERLEIVNDLSEKRLIKAHESVSITLPDKKNIKKTEKVIEKKETYTPAINLTNIHKEKTRSDKRVIIVGNSPSVLSHNYGKIIDDFDVVIRVNRCVTKGFEKKVGGRIDIWATTRMNTSGHFYPDNYKTIQCLWTRSNTVNLKDKKWLPNDFPSSAREKRLIMFKHQVFWKRHMNPFLHQFNLKKEPCTGLITILTACRFFNDITVHGFTFGNQSEDDLRVAAYYRDSELDTSGKHIEDKLWLADRNLQWASKGETAKRRDVLIHLWKYGISDKYNFPNGHAPIKLLNASDLNIS